MVPCGFWRRALGILLCIALGQLPCLHFTTKCRIVRPGLQTARQQQSRSPTAATTISQVDCESTEFGSTWRVALLPTLPGPNPSHNLTHQGTTRSLKHRMSKQKATILISMLWTRYCASSWCDVLSLGLGRVASTPSCAVIASQLDYSLLVFKQPKCGSTPWALPMTFISLAMCAAW